MDKSKQTLNSETQSKKCPFLKPYEIKDEMGTFKSIEQECIKEKCELWHPDKNRCSFPTIVDLLEKK